MKKPIPAQKFSIVNLDSSVCFMDNNSNKWKVYRENLNNKQVWSKLIYSYM